MARSTFSWFTRWRRTRTPQNQGTIGPVGTLIRLALLLLFGIFFGLPLVWLILAPTKTDTQLSQGFHFPWGL